MASIETKNHRRLRHAFIAVVFLIVLLIITEVVLVAVMLTRSNGMKKESPTFSERQDNVVFNNESAVAKGGQLSDRRYPSTASSQEKSTKSTDLTTEGTAFTIDLFDPEEFPDETYTTEVPITDLDILNTYAASTTTKPAVTSHILNSTFMETTLTEEEGFKSTTPSTSTTRTTSATQNQRPDDTNLPPMQQASSTISTDLPGAHITFSIKEMELSTIASQLDKTEESSQNYPASDNGDDPFETTIAMNDTIITTEDIDIDSYTTTGSTDFEWTDETTGLTASTNSPLHSHIANHTSSTTEDKVSPTANQFDKTKQSTKNYRISNREGADVETATDDLIITTERSDDDLYTTTEVDESADETSSELIIPHYHTNSVPYPVNEITTDPSTTTSTATSPTSSISANASSGLHKPTNQPTTSLSMSSVHYATKEPITVEIATRRPTSQKSTPNQSLTIISASTISTDDLKLTTDSSYGLTSTKPTKPTPGTNKNTVPRTSTFLHVPPSFTTTTTTTTSTTTTTTTTRATTTTEPEICHIRYDENCYALLVGDMSYDSARKACRTVKGRLSDITSRQHYNAMMTYIRQNIPEPETKLDAWTAMSLMITTGKVRMSNFNMASFTRWYPGQPQQDFNRRHIYLHVPKIEADPKGMVNENPKSKLSGALCIIKKRSSNRR